MLLPIHTNISTRRTPYANYILIAANVLIFLLSFGPHHVGLGQAVEPLRSWAQQFMLTPDRPGIWQFVSYAFLHSGWLHLFSNMYILYIFGNNVNDRLGNIGYVCFYLGGAVFSGLGHAMLHINPVLGASGAVAAVTGAYLVLFPHTFITVVYFFYFIGTFEIKAMYLIALKLIFVDNVLGKYVSDTNIAFDAHLAGYGFGIVAILGLLATKLIDSSYMDLWGSLRQWNRRRQFRDAVSDTPVHRTAAEQADVDKILDLRGRIAQEMSRHNLSEASGLYRQLIQLDPRQVLPRQLQLDMANQLMADGQWEASAKAYELFLASYSNYEHVEQVHLMLGLLYGRYLNKPTQAMEYLTRASDRLTDSGQKTLCQQELNRLQNP